MALIFNPCAIADPNFFHHADPASVLLFTWHDDLQRSGFLIQRHCVSFVSKNDHPVGKVGVEFSESKHGPIIIASINRYVRSQPFPEIAYFGVLTRFDVILNCLMMS